MADSGRQYEIWYVGAKI